jgi:SH3-like domain-containing protein
MRRWILLCCASLALLLLTAPGWAAANDKARPAIPSGDLGKKPVPKTVTVAVDYAQLYACGGRNCEMVGALDSGERLAILESAGDWRRVRSYDTGKTGWAHAKDLSGWKQWPLAEVLDEYLEVRACGKVSKKCPVRGRLLLGDVVFVLQRGKTWSKIMTKDETLSGWVKTARLRFR